MGERLPHRAEVLTANPSPRPDDMDELAATRPAFRKTGARLSAKGLPDTISGPTHRLPKVHRYERSRFESAPRRRDGKLLAATLRCSG